MNRSFILILNVLFVYASVFLEQRHPIYTQLCSDSEEALGSYTWPWEVLERLCLGDAILRHNLSEASHGGARLHSVSQTVNSVSPRAVKGRCLFVCS